MKVVLLNLSGNVGKTMIATNMLSSRMGTPRYFDVESFNIGAETSGLDVDRYKGKKFGEMLDELMLEDNAIVDVGTSNVDDFLKQMQQFSGSHEEFDYFVVPVCQEDKIQGDTVNTIRMLQTIGIDRKRIRLVFNMVELEDSVTDTFAPLFGLAELDKSFTIKQEAIIYKNEVFERLRAVGKNLGDVTKDPIDYRAQLRIATTPEEKETCVQMIALKRLAITANKNLDDVFKVLFK